MTYKSGMKVKVNGEVPVLNPEDHFNDMIEDGFSVEEALDTVITESIVISKVNDLLEDNGDDSLYCGCFHSIDDDDVFEVTIEKEK